MGEIKRITVKGFKSIKSLVDFELGHLNVIVGANGSGKSNLINAVFLLMISAGAIRRESDRIPKGIQSVETDDSLSELVRNLRMVDSEGNMRMDFTFVFGESDARYVLEFDPSGKLVRECLTNRVNSRKGTLFRLEDGKEPYFVRGLIRDKRFRDRIKSGISQYWGKRSLVYILNEEIHGSNTPFLNDNMNPYLLEFVNGIDSIIVESRMFPTLRRGQVTLPCGIIEQTESDRLDVIEDILSRFFSRLYSDVRGAFFKKENRNGQISYELFFKKRISGKIRNISARMESTGTLTMMNVMGSILACVDGGCVFVDEMDTGVHDLLITGVIEQTIPEIRGQLIATTHNTCLMDALSADNVYVIGIDRNGYKKIRCVSSIERIRPANSIRHKYYENNFLGIPHIADLGLRNIAELGKGEE